MPRGPNVIYDTPTKARFFYLYDRREPNETVADVCAKSDGLPTSGTAYRWLKHRKREGEAAAVRKTSRANNTRRGRPRIDVGERLEELLAKGAAVDQAAVLRIAEEAGCSVATLYRRLTETKRPSKAARAVAIVASRINHGNRPSRAKRVVGQSGDGTTHQEGRGQGQGQEGEEERQKQKEQREKEGRQREERRQRQKQNEQQHRQRPKEQQLQTSMDAEAPNVLLFGSGAIGTIYVYLLQRAGCKVTAVCRSNYDAARESGFVIHSRRFQPDDGGASGDTAAAAAADGAIRIRPRVVRTVQEVAGEEPFDYVIVCAKAFPAAATAAAPAASAAEAPTSRQQSTPGTIAPVVTPGKTVIVLIQNGIGIEAEYKTLFPTNTVLSCVVYLPTTQTAPGVIEMGDFELLEIGTYPSYPRPTASTSGSAEEAVALTAIGDAHRFRSLVAAGGGTASFHADIQVQRWKKLLINASWNPICALTRASDTCFLESSVCAADYTRGVMRQVVGLANAVLGYRALSGATDVEEAMQRAIERMGTKGVEPSMLADVRNGRRMEVEAILGMPVRMGKERGVDVGMLEGLYVLAKALDQSLAREGREA